MTLTLDEIGCTNSITDSIFVEQTPTLAPFAVNVWPEEGCLPLTVNFADAETLWPLDYHWHFSDGTSSLQDSPAHLFTESGTFSASVDVVSTGNCPATLSFDLPQTITVYPPPQVGFRGRAHRGGPADPHRRHHLDGPGKPPTSPTGCPTEAASAVPTGAS